MDQQRFSTFQQEAENARLTEEARHANRLKSEFVATVSHELRAPLSVIVGYTDLLLDDTCAAEADEQREMLQRIREQSMQLNDLIQAMLDLNRLETQRLPLTISPFTLGDLIGTVRSTVSPQWRRDGVALDWDVRDASAVLRSDRAKVAMILRNLIHNALKYTEVGCVTIVAELSPSDRRVVFTVADTGPGIAAEDQALIFEMFRQGRNSPARGGGVGLGLHIVKRFAEVLGGQVSVDSQPGSGARFVVSLPIEAPHATMV